MSARGLLRGMLLSAHLISIANVHSSAHAEALAHTVPADRLAPILDVEKLPPTTADGRVISRSPAHHIQNCLRKRIDRAEIPRPETIGVSMAMLMRVAAMLAELNRDDLGSWASLAYLSRACDASQSQIRAVHNYLVEHGHSLRLSRLKADDRKIGSAKRPMVTTRTTIRPVFAITCDMAETLTEEQVLDLIAAGEKRPVATEPGERHVERVAEAQPVRATEAGRVAADEVAAGFVRDLAAEHRCLVEPLAALSMLTGISLPTASVAWVADEADRAGLVDLDNVDLTHAADALNELHAHLVKERRGAEAMGDSPPKIRGGRAGLRALILRFLEGKATWLKKHGDVYAARDDARAREEEYEAQLTPEQRERRGLAPVPLSTSGSNRPPADSVDHMPCERAPAPAPVLAPAPEERAAQHLRQRIGVLGARIFAEADHAKRAELELERAGLERKLAELPKTGPPD